MKKADFANTAVILPVYNSEVHLPKLLSRVMIFVPPRQIIAVDDGSSDNSADICKAHDIYLHQFSQNWGKGAALAAGFSIAARLGFDFAFSLDSDEQHPPEHFPAFLSKQNQTDADLVLGFRQLKRNLMPFARICSNKLTSFIVSLLIKDKILDSQCGFRLYRLDKLDNLKLNSSRYQFETEILLELAKNEANLAQVPVDTIYGNETSHIHHWRDTWNFIKIIWQYLTK